MRIEEVPKTPSGNLGDLILSTFAAHDLLLEMESDDKLLAIKPRLAAHVRLEQVCNQSGNQLARRIADAAAHKRFSFSLEGSTAGGGILSDL